MKILGMSAAELDIPARYSMFEEIASYFGTDKGASRKILNILSKHSPKDGLEAVWRYVRLENEKRDTLKVLNPAEFDDPISEELKAGMLTLASMKKIQEDMDRKEKTQRDKAARSNTEQSKEEGKVLQSLVEKFQPIRSTLAQVKEINRTLERYGN